MHPQTIKCVKTQEFNCQTCKLDLNMCYQDINNREELHKFKKLGNNWLEFAMPAG